MLLRLGRAFNDKREGTWAGVEGNEELFERSYFIFKIPEKLKIVQVQVSSFEQMAPFPCTCAAIVQEFSLSRRSHNVSTLENRRRQPATGWWLSSNSWPSSILVGQTRTKTTRKRNGNDKLHTPRELQDMKRRLFPKTALVDGNRSRRKTTNKYSHLP